MQPPASGDADEKLAYDVEAVSINMKKLLYVSRHPHTSRRFPDLSSPRSTARTLGALTAGTATGVAGVTGLAGFAYFFLANALVSIILLTLGMRSATPGEYVPRASLAGFLVLDGVSDQALTFVLFWTLAYALVWIYV